MDAELQTWGGLQSQTSFVANDWSVERVEVEAILADTGINQNCHGHN
jgi:hypothetical protein